MIVGKKIASAVAKNNLKQNPLILRLQNNLFPVRYGSNQAKFGGKSVLNYQSQNAKTSSTLFPGPSALSAGGYQSRVYYSTNDDKSINKSKLDDKNSSVQSPTRKAIDELLQLIKKNVDIMANYNKATRYCLLSILLCFMAVHMHILLLYWKIDKLKKEISESKKPVP